MSNGPRNKTNDELERLASVRDSTWAGRHPGFAYVAETRTGIAHLLRKWLAREKRAFIERIRQ